MNTSNKGIVISCFDYSGNIVLPWADAGYKCYCVDFRHGYGERREGNITYVGANLHYEWLPPDTNIAFAAFSPPFFPVEDGVSRFRNENVGVLVEAIQLFYTSVCLAELSLAPYLIECPAPEFSRYWREPDRTLIPSDYTGYIGGGYEHYERKSYLWFGGGFIMPEPKPLGPCGGSKMFNIPTSPYTPHGFAQAVFEANRPDREDGAHEVPV